MMLAKKSGFILLCTFIFCIGVGVSSCNNTNEVDQIKKQINALQTAVEDEKPNDFIVRLDEGFVGNGHLNRALIKKYLILNLMRHSNIQVHISHIDIHINDADPTLAQVNIKALITGGKGLIPEQGRLMDIQSQWVRTTEGWIVKIARWTPRI